MREHLGRQSLASSAAVNGIAFLFGFSKCETLFGDVSCSNFCIGIGSLITQVDLTPTGGHAHTTHRETIMTPSPIHMRSRSWKDMIKSCMLYLNRSLNKKPAFVHPTCFD